MSRHLVLGGPGAGKTFRLLQIVDHALQSGIKPTEIAFVAYTNAAADEAKERAAAQFGFNDDQLPYFRTIHSLCFREMGLSRHRVIGPSDLNALTQMTGEDLGEDSPFSDGPAVGYGKSFGNLMLFLDHVARATRQPLVKAWNEHNSPWDWWRQLRFSQAYAAYKQEVGKIDFTDMLDQYVREGAPVPVKLAIVDEGQDLTLLQWAAVDRAFAGAEQFYVGGDDDQSIHRWAGAAQAHFLSLDADREVLPVSHRLPRIIFNLGRKIIEQVGQRYPKRWSPADRDGRIEWYNDPEEVDLSQGSWLVLGRNAFHLDRLSQKARKAGVHYSLRGRRAAPEKHVRAIQLYEALRAGRGPISGADAFLLLRAMGEKPSAELKEDGEVHDGTTLGITAWPIWHDALKGIPLDDREFYLACLRRGEKLTEPPRVRLETIHGAKGKEADQVMLMTDLSRRTHAGLMVDPDSEHRVFYVGVTRAREALHVVLPQSEYGYTFPFT